MKILVLGGGSWGTALARHLCLGGNEVSLWMRNGAEEARRERRNKKYLPDLNLDPSLNILSDPEEELKSCEGIVLAIPSQQLRNCLSSLKAPNPNVWVISGIKGLERESGKRMSEVIHECWNLKNIAVLSGPSHAEEVARKCLTSVVIASLNKDLGQKLASIFSSGYFRCYYSTDVIGVELGGTLKNPLAIAAGIAQGLQLGDNALSALITRGLAEMRRFANKFHAKPETLFGLSGLGDLIVTANSPHSRNRHVGIMLAEGKSRKKIEQEMNMVAEGIMTAPAVVKLAEEKNIEVPITKNVMEILFQEKKVSEALKELMRRSLKSEFEI